MQKQVTRTSRRRNKKIVEARGWKKRDLSRIVRVFDKNDDFAGGRHSIHHHRPDTNTCVHDEEMWHLPQSRESCKKLPENNNNNSKKEKRKKPEVKEKAWQK